MGAEDEAVMAEATVVAVPMTGLNPLRGLAAFQVNQEKEMLEAALNVVDIDYEGANKYKVRDPSGRPMYFVAEESGCCMRQCCNPNHSMTLHVTDMTGEQVMTMKRPWTWNCCCCEIGNMCGAAHMDVYLGNKHDCDDEHKIGTVRMPCGGGGFTPKLNIQDKHGDKKAVVKGPCCCISDMCGAKFEVDAPGGRSIGDVKKLGIQSAGDVATEFATDADNYLISFPKDLNVEYKALMIGALILLDYLFFEDEGACEFQPWRCVCKFKCCDCYCCGCIFPCSCNCPAKDASDTNDGAPPAADVVVAATSDVVLAQPIGRV